MKKNIIIGITLGIMFLTLMFLLTVIDVQMVGPQGTSVGFASLNVAVHDFIGTSDLCYTLSEIFGLSDIFVAGLFGLLGLSQWVNRKNILKVDQEILATGILYSLAIIIYFIFSKYSVNYRPVVMEGELMPEPSYPSSHTVLVIVSLGSTIILANKYFKTKSTRKLVKILSFLLIALTIITRLLAGIHWLTDIIGSLLLSFCMLNLYVAVLKIIKKQNQQKNN